MSEMVKKNDSGVVRLTVTLFGICAACALILGLTNMVTLPVIKENQAKKEAAAIAAEVMPGFEGTLTQVNYTGDDGTINAIQKTSDGGFVVTVSPKGSFSGVLTIMVGIDQSKAVTGVSVTNSQETSGYGARASEPEFRSQFVGKTGEIKLTKDGGEIESITGASTTSGAVCSGVTSAIKATEFTSDGPYDPSLAPAEPDPTDDVNVLSVEPSGDGYAVTVDCSALGFQQLPLTLRVSIGADKAVTGIEVVESEQTEGVGSNALTPEYLQQYVGQSGSAEVDAYAGASYTSNAVNVGVNAALKAVEQQG